MSVHERIIEGDYGSITVYFMADDFMRYGVGIFMCGNGINCMNSQRSSQSIDFKIILIAF